jgi:hypothetical protein
MNIEHIARAVHEMNRRWCQLNGDDSQAPWEKAPGWQRKATYAQIQFHIDHPEAKANHSHDSWLNQKLNDGWKYGPVKDPAKKEHPDIVPYEQLSAVARAKDSIFSLVVDTLK